MTLTVRLDPAAEAEFAEIVRWYDERSPGLGSAFADAVDDLLAVIGETPLAFTTVDRTDPRLAMRRASMVRFPYSIVYLIGEAEVRVLGLAHQRRDTAMRSG